ncbi:MAG: ferrous iron transport protein A [Clostridia bacterium]|nr:ferrous iron transport protein A [Clostridia bacterium]
MKKENSEKNKATYLSDLKIGQKAKVIKLNEQNKAIRRHLLDMGITKGVKVTIKKIAPMGDPVDIELRDYELCLRKADLKQIEVEVIE